ncbi:PEP-CTERM sorting domain-containing protein [bacterium]|nr:PEP-CTERM sorting domain-containing protein [bacterium]
MFLRSVLTFALALATCTAATGADLINTLDATQALAGTGLNGFRVSQSFRTTLVDTIVTDVTLKMFTDATTGTFRISIFDATGPGDRPGTQVAQIYSETVDKLPTGGYTNFHLGGLSVNLSPDRMYYIVADATTLNAEDKFVYWQYTDSPPPGSHGDTSIYWQSFDGSTWQDEYVGSPQLMRVVAVPEPGTYALAGLGTLVLGVFGRRQRRKS